MSKLNPGADSAYKAIVYIFHRLEHEPIILLGLLDVREPLTRTYSLLLYEAVHKSCEVLGRLWYL